LKKVRLAVGILTLSAAGYGALVGYEGFIEKARPPIPGDRPTVGFGSTYWEDGRAVKQGETITPHRAIRLSISHIGKDEAVLKKCVTGDMYPEEWDILVDFAYWRGSGGACRSEVVKNINQGNYVAACGAYLNLDSRRAAGKDCKIKANGCGGVWNRAQERYNKCMALQN
jgi:lysozyme